MVGNVLAFRRYVSCKGMFGVEWTTRYVERFLKDPVFWKAFKNTLVQSISILAINFPIPFIFAIAQNELHWEFFKKYAQTASYISKFLLVNRLSLTNTVWAIIRSIRDLFPCFSFYSS